MLFKRREPTEEQIVAKAEQLILDQLSETYTDWTVGRKIDAPAAEYAHSLVKERMSDVDILKKVDHFLECEMLDEVVRKHVSSALKDILKEDLIKEIVQKINDVQVGRSNNE